MSTPDQSFLIQLCVEKQEPCVPGYGCESWFSVAFVAEIMGYDAVKHFTEKLNKLDIPRHPVQGKCVRFSDIR